MIEITKSYKLTLTEQQAKELLEILQTEKDTGNFGADKDLNLVFIKLKEIFVQHQWFN